MNSWRETQASREYVAGLPKHAALFEGYDKKSGDAGWMHMDDLAKEILGGEKEAGVNAVVELDGVGGVSWPLITFCSQSISLKPIRASCCVVFRRL